jgi:hypothetical protein
MCEHITHRVLVSYDYNVAAYNYSIKPRSHSHTIRAGRLNHCDGKLRTAAMRPPTSQVQR